MSDITKRAATIAILGAVLAKMAHADELPKADSFQAPVIANPNGFSGQTSIAFDRNEPQVWSINLDRMASLDVYLGKEKVTISAAEIFAALKTP